MTLGRAKHEKSAPMKRGALYMTFLSDTFFFYYSAAIFLLSAFAVAKIITLDWKFHLKETLYFLTASLFGAVVSALSREYYNFFFHMFRNVIIFILLFYYFYRIKLYSFKRAAILMLVSSYTIVSLAQFLTLFFYNWFPDFYSHFVPSVIPGESSISWLEYLHISLLLPFSIFIAFALLKIFGRFRVILSQSERLQTIFLCGGTLVSLIVLFQLGYMRYNKVRLNVLDWTFFPYDLILTVIIIIFYAFVVYQNNRHQEKLKEERFQALHRYTQELEQQQTAMRKFKHDYQNILLSLDSFIKEKKWDDLEEYYDTKIKTASAVITSNEFALEALSKIKVNEIKSMFTAKLTVAQNMGIDATFEAHEEIDSIPVDSVSLVRMLGILLDNAIEALTELGHGTLRVAYFREDTNIVFVVQNTCLPGLKLMELEKKGFSTKGKGRGQGLSILYEIASSCPNIIRETGIKGDVFTQKLTINE